VRVEMNRLVLVDIDGMIYLAGYAGEQRSYDTVMEDSAGNLHTMRFDSVSDIKFFLDSNKDFEMIDKELCITPLPVEYSLRVVKNKLTEIQSRYGKNMRVYVKGNGVNFRDVVYTVQKYKGNRKTAKPYHYDSIVDYMITYWDAITVDGKEVDDQLALDAKESSKPVVICSPDKDLDQIPGLHWNYTKAVEYEVDPEEAQRFFWEQCLSGDNADNILGVWKIGQKTAQKMVDSWYEDGLTQPKIWDKVIEAYAVSLEHPSCPYKDMDVKDLAIQTARAVWMQDTANKLWTPPNEPEETMDIEVKDGWV